VGVDKWYSTGEWGGVVVDLNTVLTINRVFLKEIIDCILYI
jgi:hypothetical protein